MSQSATDGARQEATQTASFFIPDLCGVRQLFVLVLVSQLLAFVMTLAGMGGVGDFLPRLGLVSIYVQWVALVSAGSLCSLRVFLVRCPVWLVTLLALSLVIAVSLVFQAVYQFQ